MREEANAIVGDLGKREDPGGIMEPRHRGNEHEPDRVELRRRYAI